MWGGVSDLPVEHSSATADFDAQIQLQSKALEDLASGETVMVQSNQSPYPDDQSPRSRKNRLSTVTKEEPEDEIDNRSNGANAPSTSPQRGLPQADSFDLERARRHAAATKLPDNSGIWALSEKQLYYHLALRGFEPLVPEHWMIDFKTLPLSLFANENSDRPLIEPLYGSDFRAIRALQTLIETGKDVRGKAMSARGVQVARKMHQAIKAYFTWALADGDFDTAHDNYIPAYHITVRKQGQSGRDAIATLETRLRELGIRHHEHLDILSSIESGAASNPRWLQGSQTQVFDDSAAREPPVLVGMLIVSKILHVFTLNAHNSIGAGPAEDIGDSGLRFVAKFDFSNPAYDVWHALAIAITVAHIREGMEKKDFKKVDHHKIKIKREKGEYDEDLEDSNFRPARSGKSGLAGKRKSNGKQAVNSGWFHNEGFEEDATLIIDDDDPDR